MLSVRTGQMLLLISALAVTPAIASRIHRPPTAGHGKESSRRLKRTKIHGQRTIDASRATEIQTALMREKYLTVAPTGQWDEQTQAAMQRYQAEHGWQTKLVPDSRALISLGLGPAADAPDAVVASKSRPASSAAPLTQAPAEDEPAADTLASVHSISQ